jgi:hypothetical protein
LDDKTELDAFTDALGLGEAEAEDGASADQHLEEADDEASAATEPLEAETAEDEEADDDGADNSDEQKPDEDAEAPQTFTVKVDGKEVEATLEDLTRSYSGNQKIQADMRQNAEDRKALEAQFSEIHQQTQQLQYLMQAAHQGAFVPPQPPDQDLLQTDPYSYMQQRAIYDEQVRAYNENVAVYQQHQAQLSQRQHEDHQAYLQREKASLIEALPDLGDPAKGPALATKMQEAAVNAYGFDQQELAEVTDSRMLRVLHDAARYRELMSRKDVASAKAEKARPAARAGAAPGKGTQGKSARRAAARLAKEGSEAAFTDWLLSEAQS